MMKIRSIVLWAVFVALAAGWSSGALAGEPAGPAQSAGAGVTAHGSPPALPGQAEASMEDGWLVWATTVVSALALLIAATSLALVLRQDRAAEILSGRSYDKGDSRRLAMIEIRLNRLQRRAEIAEKTHARPSRDAWRQESKTPGPALASPRSRLGYGRADAAVEPPFAVYPPRSERMDATPPPLPISRSASSPTLGNDVKDPGTQTSSTYAPESGMVAGSQSGMPLPVPELGVGQDSTPAPEITRPADRPYHDEILPKAWRVFIEADGGSYKGSVAKFEESVVNAVGSIVARPVVARHSECQNLATVRVEQPSGEVEIHGLPLTDSFRSVMGYFEAENQQDGGGFRQIKEVARTAQFDAASIQKGGGWELAEKGSVRL